MRVKFITSLKKLFFIVRGQHKLKKIVKQSRYRPGVTQRVPGS